MNYKIASYALLATIIGCGKSADIPPSGVTQVSTSQPSFQSFGTYDISLGYGLPDETDKSRKSFHDVKGQMTGDFDGDGKTDIALLISTSDAEKVRIIIIKNDIPQKTLDEKLTPEKEDKK